MIVFQRLIETSDVLQMGISGERESLKEAGRVRLIEGAREEEATLLNPASLLYASPFIICTVLDHDFYVDCI